MIGFLCYHKFFFTQISHTCIAFPPLPLHLCCPFPTICQGNDCNEEFRHFPVSYSFTVVLWADLASGATGGLSATRFPQSTFSRGLCSTKVEPKNIRALRSLSTILRLTSPLPSSSICLPSILPLLLQGLGICQMGQFAFTTHHSADRTEGLVDNAW